MNKIDWFILIMIFAGLISSIYSATTTTEDNLFCSVKSSCDLVQNSSYSHILGIKLSILGVCAFLALLVAFIHRDVKIFNILFVIMAYVGALLGCVFILIQIWIIRAICESCLIIDSIAIIIYILIKLNKNKDNKK